MYTYIIANRRTQRQTRSSGNWLQCMLLNLIDEHVNFSLHM